LVIPKSKIKFEKDKRYFYLTGVILTYQLKNLDPNAYQLKIVGTMPDEIMDDFLNYFITNLSYN